MQRFLLWFSRLPGVRTIVWRSAFLQRIAGYLIRICIPRIRCEPYGFVMVCDSLNPTFLGLCVDGGYEKENAAFIAASLRPGNIVVDVGANDGFFSVLAARIVGERGRVLAIEPDPVVVHSLRRNLTENACTNVDIAEVCLGEVEADVVLHRSRVSGVNSISKANIIGPSKPWKVPSARFDDLARERGIDRVDLIKMDIQGAEFSCLRGMKECLERCHPIVVFEFWPDGIARMHEDPVAMLDMLHDLGYSLRCLEDPSLNDTAMGRVAIVAAVKARGNGYGGYANIAATPPSPNPPPP